MAVHRTYEGYPPDTRHWAPGDEEPADHATLYDHRDAAWRRGTRGWFRESTEPSTEPFTGPLTAPLRAMVNSLPWATFVQQHGPVSSAPRTRKGTS